MGMPHEEELAPLRFHPVPDLGGAGNGPPDKGCPMRQCLRVQVSGHAV